MYLMQTVSTGPSSRSFPQVDKLDEITIMNSAEDISKYSDNNSHYRSPTLARRAGTELQEPQKPKKDKKWSLGGFFRRKKKEIESESSTEEEIPQKKGFLQRRKQKKEEKRKRRGNKSLGHFDHIVVTPIINGNRELEEYGGVLSEPVGYYSPKNERIPSRESLSKKQDLNLSRGSLASQDSITRKSRREKVKARAEALRDKLKNDSSSDEGSQRSTTSSITRFKSDDSLSRKDGTTRKSRSARTERYNKRLTKEDENVLNKEAEDNQQTRVQVNRWVVVDELSKSPPIKPYIKPTLNYSPSVPLPQKPYSNVSTIPPSHIIHRTSSNLSDNPRNYFNKPAGIYTNPVRHPVDPMRSIPRSFTSGADFKPEKRSFSYDCNINRSPTPGSEEQVLHVHFPIGKPVPKQRNPNLINNNKVTPPPPPPRRVFGSQYENTRPMSYAFENGNHGRPVPVHQPTFDRNSYNLPTQNINRTHSFGWQNYRSNSEDHIAQTSSHNPPVVTRPSSATPDVPQQRFIRRHLTTDQYKYFAEKTPRSRRPIHITAAPILDQSYLSDSQVVTRNLPSRHPVNAASEFWKQKDAEEINRRKSQLIETKDKQKNVFSVSNIPKTGDSLSSLSGNSDTSPLNAKTFFEDPIRPLSIVSEKSEVPEISDSAKKGPPEPPIRRYSRQSSASSSDNWNNDPDEPEKKKKSSNNLEDALDELEAIYKSLRLGDEDLLDRAERRDFPPAVTEKLLSQTDSYVSWSTPGTQSDSGYNYDPKKRSRRSTIPDKLNDDMAYRRLNKDRPPPLDPSVAVSQVSYLLASPVLGAPPVDENDNESIKTYNEPDITLDDVVYRNIKHTNNSLKVAEPQPPFGIPIGPITGASNSDYLHAVPDNNNRPMFIPRKSPDIVKDDLAYRSLRKDNSNFFNDDLANSNRPDPRKRKAVRSITTNIFNAMNRDYTRGAESENEFDRAQSLTDIADAMEIARQILKERQNKIYRKSASSDNESKAFKSSFNCNTSTETLILDKPPICPTPDRKSSKPPTKESTPITVSPAPEETPLDKNHLTDLLTALAIEARETSEKLGNDLKLLDEESRKTSPCNGAKSPFDDEHRNNNLKESLKVNSAKSSALIKTVDERDNNKEESRKASPGNVAKSPFDDEHRHNNLKLEESLKDSGAKSSALIKTFDERDNNNEESRNTSLGNVVKSPFDDEHRQNNLKIEESLKANGAKSSALIKTSDERDNNSEELRKASPGSVAKYPVLIKSLNETLSDIDAVSEHAKLCEKLLGAVVESTKLISHSVQPLEEASEISEPKIYKSVANVVVTRKADMPEPDPRSEQCSESEHDYENIDNEEKCVSPFEENKVRLLADFEELKKDLFSKEDNLGVNELSASIDQETFDELQSSSLKGEAVCDSNLIFETPKAFSTDFDYNYIPEVLNQTKSDSGFHTESQNSSSAESSLLVFGREQILSNAHSHWLDEKSDTNGVAILDQQINFESSSSEDQLTSNNVFDSDHPNSKNIDGLKQYQILSKAHSHWLDERSDTNGVAILDQEINFESSSSEDQFTSNNIFDSVHSNSKNIDSSKQYQNNNCLVDSVDASLYSNEENISSNSDTNTKVSSDNATISTEEPIVKSISNPSKNEDPLSKSCPLHDLPSSSTSCCTSQDKLDSNQESWYRNPENLALACSYTLAFVHQLAIVDFVTLLGILLAIVTVVAAFVL